MNSRTSVRMVKQAALRARPPTEASTKRAKTVRTIFARTPRNSQQFTAAKQVLKQEKSH